VTTQSRFMDDVNGAAGITSIKNVMFLYGNVIFSPEKIPRLYPGYLVLENQLNPRPKSFAVREQRAGLS